jgi:hypothetical protein
MRGQAELTAPELAVVLGTRAALGIGLGFLLANRFSEDQRRTIGWTLLGGAFAAAALAYELFGRPRPFTLAWGSERDEGRSSSKSNELLSREMMRVGD